MMWVVRLAWALAALAVGWSGSARADDIAAAGRGVVRVVTIAAVDGEVVGFGHGSGVAIAPNRVLTNAHVMELADRYPDNVVIGIVPSEGDKSYQGKVIAYDSQRDLALIEFAGTKLPPATLYTGPAGDGEGVVALGYPGNVDLATARSAADYIRPMSPVRSEGVFSGRRALSGVEVLLHTASIARGNSGGPLLDRCGRVLGINSAITKGEEGDSTFGFAIADSEVAAFLREAGQPYASVGTPCTSIEQRLRDDSEADAEARAEAATARRDAATRAAMAREEALAKARNEAERTRENVMAIAGVLLVMGALAIGGAGLAESRGRRRAAIWTLVGGVVGVLAAVVVFVLRPSGDPEMPADRPAAVAEPGSAAALGKLVCVLQPERSRVTVSSIGDVALDWGRGGCANGRTAFVPTGARWERIIVPDNEQTVSVRGFDPATRTYTDTRYFLGASAMDAVRKAAGKEPAACGAGQAALEALAGQQAAVRATLPPLPNEKLVYRCQAAGK
jgi:V8-like Glu-specific endopeptidase